jgi:hypothetical protein
MTEALMVEEKIEKNNSTRVTVVFRSLNLRLYNAIRRMEPIAEIAFNRSIENLKEIVIE